MLAILPGCAPAWHSCREENADFPTGEVSSRTFSPNVKEIIPKVRSLHRKGPYDLIESQACLRRQCLKQRSHLALRQLVEGYLLLVDLAETVETLNEPLAFVAGSAH